jgi:hypothetical protein
MKDSPYHRYYVVLIGRACKLGARTGPRPRFPLLADCVEKVVCNGRANLAMAAEAFDVSGREDHVTLARFTRPSYYSL